MLGTIPTISHHVRYGSWMKIHQNTTSLVSPLYMRVLSTQPELHQSNGWKPCHRWARKFACFYPRLIDMKLYSKQFSGQSFWTSQRFGIQEMVCTHCFQGAWCHPPVQGTFHQSSMQASCPKVLLSGQSKSLNAANQQTPKPINQISRNDFPDEGDSIDVYCSSYLFQIDGSKISGMQSRSQGNEEQPPASGIRWHPQTHMFLLRAPNYIIICSFSCHAQIGIVPYRLWGFLRSQTLRQLMQNRGIGIGSSPIGNEGFAHPSARQRRRKTKLVLQ